MPRKLVKYTTILSSVPGNRIKEFWKVENPVYPIDLEGLRTLVESCFCNCDSPAPGDFGDFSDSNKEQSFFTLPLNELFAEEGNSGDLLTFLGDEFELGKLLFPLGLVPPEVPCIVIDRVNIGER